MAKPQTREVTWHQSIQEVLNKAGQPLHYTEIADRIVQQRLRKSTGATPAQTVNSIVSTDINSGGQRYIRVDGGIYALRAWLEKSVEKNNDNKVVVQSTPDDETGAIKAFGMYWERSQINWDSPKVLGKQEGADQSVDFSNQLGVYILHDRERVIYVGRAEDSLLKRLIKHTTGRFGNRWDRFSWFGICSVGSDAKLAKPADSWARHDVIQTMEAVLIECMEPAQNRRRGDNLGANEFIQLKDPEFVKSETRRILAQLVDKI
jgi:hypothetical protein